MMGQTIAHYQITAKLGQGGMGAVYRATDTKLDREVAIKVLPESFAQDRERLARFEREAKVLASLNHPNIAGIFGLEQSGNSQALVLELVEGEDLSERLKRGPLPVEEALEVCKQIAEALEAAHEKGIIHRDLKPGNVKLTAEGKVKVLDFGIAKALVDRSGGDATTVTGTVTKPGALLGTPAYMSPEQARGEPVDQRSDIWSFGAVLFECLTGNRLFGGRTASDLIEAVLHAEPDWGQLPRGTPPGVRSLLRRCLAKHSARRLHHVADARLEMEDMGVGEASSEPPAIDSDGARAVRRWRSAGLLLAGAILSLTLAEVSGWLGGASSAPVRGNPLAKATFTRFTDFFPGDKFGGAISPDGSLVSFLSDRDGVFDVLVGQVDSLEFRNVTHNLPDLKLQDVRAPIRSVGFTGDDVLALWFREGSSPGRIETMSFLGDRAQKFLEIGVAEVAWSRDGRIVYHLSSEGDPVFVADATGENKVQILSSEAGIHQHFPTWSPDGRWIYLVRGVPITGEMNLWRVHPDGSGLEQLTEDLLEVTSPAPIDEHTVLFCAREQNGAGPWIWTIDPETHIFERVTLGVEQYSSVSASADGRRLVATVENPRSSLSRVPILEDREATENDVEPIVLNTLRAWAPRYGAHDPNHRLFYLSSRGGGDGLWRRQDGESVEVSNNMRETALLVPPAVSPDGNKVALVLRDESGQRVHVLSADGAERRVLTDQVDVRRAVSWSPDGNWVVASGSQDGVDGLFKIPVDGGPPVRILEEPATGPVWSPAGDLIVYVGPQTGPLAPVLGVTPDGQRVKLPEIKVLREGGERFRFLPNGSGLVYMQGLSPNQDFWLYNFTTKTTRQLTRLRRRDTMRTFDVVQDADGGWSIVFDRLQNNSDQVLIELPAGADTERQAVPTN